MHDELHRLDTMLRPSVLDDLGLAAALTELTQAHRARTAAEVEASIDDSVQLDQQLRAGRLPDRPGGADQRRPARGRQPGGRGAPA